jgi:hypothetical protein
MSVRTRTADTAPAAPPSPPSLWQLGLEAQEQQREIERLALLLDSDDDESQAAAVVELETALALEEDNQQALIAKADAYCWVIGNYRAQAAYRAQQAARLRELAESDHAKADRLELALLTVLTRLQPDATRFSLQHHELVSRRSEAVDIEDEELLPRDLFRIKTTAAPDKSAIKAALKAGQVVPGARLEERRSWSIK